MGWQWHQPNHVQVICTSLHADNHASTSSLKFCTGWMPNQQCQSTEGIWLNLEVDVLMCACICYKEQKWLILHWLHDDSVLPLSVYFYWYSISTVILCLASGLPVFWRQHLEIVAVVLYRSCVIPGTRATTLLLFVVFCVVGITASEVLPNVADLCASFQFMVVHHLAKRVQRALLFCELKNLLPADRRILVCKY